MIIIIFPFGGGMSTLDYFDGSISKTITLHIYYLYAAHIYKVKLQSVGFSSSPLIVS